MDEYDVSRLELTKFENLGEHNLPILAKRANLGMKMLRLITDSTTTDTIVKSYLDAIRP